MLHNSQNTVFSYHTTLKTHSFLFSTLCFRRASSEDQPMTSAEKTFSHFVVCKQVGHRSKWRGNAAYVVTTHTNTCRVRAVQLQQRPTKFGPEGGLRSRNDSSFDEAYQTSLRIRSLENTKIDDAYEASVPRGILYQTR